MTEAERTRILANLARRRGPGVPLETPAPARRTSSGLSEKQQAFLVDLGRDCRELAQGNEHRTVAVDVLAGIAKEAINTGDRRKASEVIDSLKNLRTEWRKDDAAARRVAPLENPGSVANTLGANQRQREVEPEAGMYRLADGTIVRVYLGQRSGKMLAKRLVSEGEHHVYEYMGKATRFVKPDTAKLSLEEAKEFGRMTGHCCVCARRLDNPESVEAGIGPVCASKLA